MQTRRWGDNVLERHLVVHTCVGAKDSRVPLSAEKRFRRRENADLRVRVASEHDKFRIDGT